MPTKPASPPLLAGLSALLAGNPLAATPRGGMEFAFDGSNTGKPAPSTSGSPSGSPAFDANGMQENPPNPMQGMGPMLEDDDQSVFQQAHGLVLRQELLAMNHVAYDKHWAYVATGFPWSELIKSPGRDQYTQKLPYGTVKTQAVPNKAWDLINKAAETLLVDFPQIECSPLDASEEAQAAAELATRFLEQDAGELGTNDAQLFFERTQRALFTPTSYIECWTDPTGAGYVPLQIEAHPQAVDPNNPLIGPDGNPTIDNVLRYVTQSPTTGDDGVPVFPEGTQFTDDPTQAAPLWLPKLRGAKWNREHVRVFPETARVEDAEKVIIIGYCTLAEARRRWQAVAAMGDEEITTLCDWTPPRYLELLPPFLRARWRLTDGKKERQGSSDEQLMFYYHIYIKAGPDYPKGADVVVTGINKGFVIERKFLSKPVTVNAPDGSQKTEIRCMELPVVQLTPVPDPFEMDPQGRAFLEMFAGAVEANAHLALGFQQLISRIIHTPFVINSTSPITGEQVRNARATEDLIPVKTPNDKPEPLTPPPLPNSFFEMYNLSDDAINSIASQNRPAQGSDKQQEVSGRAREIAVQQNNVSNTSKSNVIHAAYTRWGRIKIERAMADFSISQLIRYEGEGGAQKVREWTGLDFALVGRIGIRAGTGTMLTPDMKVQYAGNLQAANLLDPAEAKEIARPAYAKRLGVGPDAHQQYIERAIASWRQYCKAGPTPEWRPQYQQWRQAMDAYQQQVQALQQAQQLEQQRAQLTAIVAGGPPPTALGPEGQNEQAMHDFEMARVQLAMLPAPVAVPQPVPPQGPEPWTPFADRPNDTEPAIAAMWTRHLSLEQSSPKWSVACPEMQDVLVRKYNAMRQAVAIASGAAPASPTQTAPAGVPQPAQSGATKSPAFPGPKPAPGNTNTGSQNNPGAAARGAVNQHTPTAARVAA